MFFCFGPSRGRTELEVWLLWEKLFAACAFCWPSTEEFILHLNHYVNGAWKAVLAFPYISFGEINTIGFSTQLQHWVYFPSYYEKRYYKCRPRMPPCLARQPPLATFFLGFTKGIVKQVAKSRQFPQHQPGSWAFRRMVGFAVHTLMFHIQTITCSLGMGQTLLLYCGQVLAFLTHYWYSFLVFFKRHHTLLEVILFVGYFQTVRWQQGLDLIFGRQSKAPFCVFVVFLFVCFCDARLKDLPLNWISNLYSISATKRIKIAYVNGWIVYRN